MDLSDYRRQIDEVDGQLIRLFARRMEISADIGAYKKEHGLPVLNAEREKEKLAAAAAASPEEFADYTRVLFSLLMELSRSYQTRLNGTDTGLTDRVAAAVSGTPAVFPAKATVACQGVRGAYSQLACDRIFPDADIFYYPTFDAVFDAIERGACRYGVLPVENSTAGTVHSVYDAMMRHRFHIVRGVKLKVEHNLMANPGASLAGVKEIWSHEQAISQCSAFLSRLENVRVVPRSNTAEAARLVAESGRTDVASISSLACADAYGLTCLVPGIQNMETNYTRFVCISRDLEIYADADRTSLMVILSHEPGSLYRMLSRFYALDINLIKLESRPLPDRDFEFMFYFDLDASVHSPRLLRLLGELKDGCESFTYLGSYSEVI